MVLIYASLLPGFIKPFGDFSEKKSLEQKWKKKRGKRENFALFSINSHNREESSNRTFGNGRVVNIFCC